MTALPPDLLPTGRRGQALAAGLLLLVLAAAWGAVASPLLALYAERAEALATRAALADRMERVAAGLPELRRQAAAASAVGPAVRVVLPGATDAVAAAAPQGMVQEMAQRGGATLSSIEALPAEQAGAYRRVGLRVTLAAPWPVLVRLLSAIAAASPVMLVDDLQLQTSRRLVRPDDAPLDASLTVLAFRAGPAP